MLGVFTAGLALTIGFVLSLTATLSGLLAGLASAILSWVTSGNFIILSYTNARATVGQPEFNAFVDLGWQLTRGLTNIIFVLALVAIGIATALRLGGTAYNFKKALPLLAIIALLINFTPVILGVMIDASNIIMNFFLQGAGGFDFFTSAIKLLNDKIMEAFGKFYDPSAQAQAVLTMLVITIVSLLNAFIMFIFSALFVVRYIAIWLLVILSPLAFACYILPATRKVWSQWWNQFVQWTIIGITGAFFLYLSSKMIELAGQGTNGGGKFFDFNTTKPLLGDWGNFAAQIMPWFVILFVMLIGLMMSFQTGAMGASAVRQGLSKSGGWLMKRRLAERAKGALAEAGAKTLGAAAAGAQRLDQRASKRGLGFLTKSLRYATSTPRDLFAKGLQSYAATKRKASIPQNFLDLISDEQFNVSRSNTLDSDQLQNFAKMGPNLGKIDKEKQDYIGAVARKYAGNTIFGKYADDIFDILPEQKDDESAIAEAGRGKKGQEKVREEQKARDEIKAEADKIEGEESSNKMVKAMQEALAEADIGKKNWAQKTDQEKETIIAGFKQPALRKLAAQSLHIGDLKSGDVKNLSKDTVTSAVFMRKLRDLTPGHLQAIQENFKTDVFAKVMDNLNAMFEGRTDKSPEEILDEYAKDPKHARMLTWFATNPAGRAFNWNGLKHMTDINGNPTNELNVYKKKLDVENLLDKNPELREYNGLLKENQRRIKLKQEATVQTNIDALNKQIEADEINLKQDWAKIEKDDHLKESWGKIEKMKGTSRKPPKQQGGQQPKIEIVRGAKQVSEERLKMARETRGRTQPPEQEVKIPLMITRQMEENLRKQGFNQEQINKMKPEEAARHLGLIK